MVNIIEEQLSNAKVNTLEGCQAMRWLKISKKVVKLTAMTLKNTQNKVLWNTYKSKEFMVGNGKKTSSQLQF